MRQKAKLSSFEILYGFFFCLLFVSFLVFVWGEVGFVLFCFVLCCVVLCCLDKVLLCRLCCVVLCCLDKVLLCSHGWTGTCYLDQASLKFTELCLCLPPKCWIKSMGHPTSGMKSLQLNILSLSPMSPSDVNSHKAHGLLQLWLYLIL